MAKTTTKPREQQQQSIAGEAPTGNLPAVVETKMKDFMAGFRARQKAYAPLLPHHVSFERFESSVRAAITKNPDLVTKCHPATLFRAAAEAAELGLSLSPTLREADILIVYNKSIGGYEAQFRPRFMGLMKLARQSGEIDAIDAHEVYEWDEFDYEYGLNERLMHRPGTKPMDYAQRPQWGVIAAYCVWEIGGKKKFEVMELADIIRIMNRTQSKKRDSGEITGPWITDFPEMARKTVVRRASKYLPLSAEKMKAFAAAVNLDDKREGGENVTVSHGDVVDVTEFGPADEESSANSSQQQSPAAKSQVDDLEARMATGAQQAKQPPRQQQQAKAPTQPAAQQRSAPQTIDNPPQPPQERAQIGRVEVPRINGAADWTAWLRLSEAAVKELPQDQRAEWKAKHKARNTMRWRPRSTT